MRKPVSDGMRYCRAAHKGVLAHFRCRRISTRLLRTRRGWSFTRAP